MGYSEAFHQFAGLLGMLHAGDERPMETMVFEALDALTIEQQAEMRFFLADLAARNPSRPELLEIWRRTGAIYQFDNGESVRTFLEMLLRALR